MDVCDLVESEVTAGAVQYTFEVQAPLLCPYHNIWGRNVYKCTESFKHNPFTITASSTSGSPVIIDSNGKFFGFLNDSEVQCAEFEFDGHGHLTITVPEGQRLFVDESSSSDSWRKYNQKVLSSFSASVSQHSFWSDIEYCTWVEQKAVAQERNMTPFEVLNHEFITSYIRRINDLGLPKGKLTIDHGWQNGDETYGDWDVHPERFPNLQKTVDLIRDNGFTPGLWMAPVWLHPLSAAARNHPDWLGPAIVSSTPDSPAKGDWNYLLPRPEVLPHLEEIFARYHSMGFMKFKFDMTYAGKELMKSLHKIIYRAVKNVAEEIEVEIHQPDIFFAPYCDAVRANDVLCNDDQYPGWRDLTTMHMDICYKSSAGRVINLDHIGGNDPLVPEETFLEHLSLYENKVGYPVVSLLPSRFGENSIHKLRSFLEDYNLRRNAISDYY